MLFNPFKINKALKQAMKYVEEVNGINEQLKAIIEEQNDVIESLQKTQDIDQKAEELV